MFEIQSQDIDLKRLVRLEKIILLSLYLDLHSRTIEASRTHEEGLKREFG
jgi:hypothetical protein